MKKTLLCCSLLLSLGSTQTGRAQCVPVITPNTMIMCPNTTDTLWADAHDTYQWLMNGNPIAGATNQYYVVDGNTDPGNLFSVVTTTTGCTGADTSADLLVDGWAFLPPYVVNVTNTMLCPGVADSVIFDFSLDSNVQWFYNGNPIAGATNDTFVAYQTGFYTAEGAPDVCPNFVMQLGLNMSVDSNTPPVILPDTLALCPGVFGTLSTSVLTYDSFQWYVDGFAIIGSNTASFFTASPGHYHVVTDEDGCILSSDSAYVYNHAVVTPTISNVGGVLYSVPGGSQLSNFQWFLNGSPIPGANDSTYSPSAGGSYTVAAFDGNCSDTSAAIVVTVSVEKLNNAVAVRVYPNPASETVYIDAAEPVSVLVVDNMGRVVHSGEQAMKHEVDVRQLAKGVYTLKLSGERGSQVEKIVVE